MNKLMLFDIDGTLIDPGGAGRTSLTLTFEEMFNVVRIESRGRCRILQVSHISM